MTDTGDVQITQIENIRLGIATWNVGNANPMNSFTKIWPNNGADFDMCVMGMQEATYGEVNLDVEDDDELETMTEEVAKTPESDGGSADLRKSGRRRQSLRQSLKFDTYTDLRKRLMIALNGDENPEEGEWCVVKHTYRVQMQLYVLVRKGLLPHITNIEEHAENTGFLHIFPNKGGLLVAFDLYGTTMAFVSTHLTAHEGVAYCAMRNDSIKEILGGVRVGDERFDVSNQKHHIFWMGDMNYRTCFDSETPPRSKRDENLTPEEEEYRKRMLEASMKVGADDEEAASPEGKSEKMNKKAKVMKQIGVVVPQIQDNAFADIVARDELNREIAGNRALAGFKALQPNFPPTFKRKRHIGLARKGDKWVFEKCTGEPGEVDPLEFYDKKRTPSYTDRILYRSMPNFEKNCTPLSFVSFEDVLTSDHKPVRATFNLTPTIGSKDILVNRKATEHSPTELIKEGHGFELIVRKMKGRQLAEMDYIGTSDPYIMVTADPKDVISVRNADHIIKTRYLSRTLDPDWGKTELRVPIVSNDIAGLSRNAHLFLSVWDYDLTNDDDVIGLTRIPFSKIFEAAKNGDPYTYDEPVYENGEICGYIQGEIILEVSTQFIASKMDAQDAIPLDEAVFVQVPDCLPCCSAI
jgi:hypothetical protein